MIFHRNRFHGYRSGDEDDHLVIDPTENFHYTSTRPLSKEEVNTLYRFAKHLQQYGDEVPFDWPADLDPNREIRIPVDE